MSSIITNRVVALFGVTAMLLALLIPQTTARAEEGSGSGDGAEAELRSTEIDDPGETTDDPTPEEIPSETDPDAVPDSDPDSGTPQTEDAEPTEVTDPDDEGEVEHEVEVEENLQTTEVEPLVAPTGTRECATNEVHVTWNRNTPGTFKAKGTANFQVDEGPCRIRFESYRVLNPDYTGARFPAGGTAVPQRTYTDENPNAYAELWISDDTTQQEVAVAVPACGDFQVDAYVGTRLKDVDSRGHDTDTTDFVAGDIFKGTPCTASLNAAHQCLYLDDEGQANHIFRLTSDKAGVYYELQTPGGTVLNSGVTTGEPQWFAVTQPSAPVHLRWGKQPGLTPDDYRAAMTGEGFQLWYANGFKNNNSTNVKPCGVWITPDKQWTVHDGVADAKVTIEADIDWPTGPWGGSHVGPDGTTVGSGSDLAEQSASGSGAVFVPFNRSYTVTEDDGPWQDVSGDGPFEGLGQFTLTPGDLGIDGDDWQKIAGAKSGSTPHTVTNAFFPEVSFQKVICDDHTLVRGNVSGTDGDDTGGLFELWGTADGVSNLTAGDLPVGLVTDFPEGCAAPTDSWQFELSFDQGFSAVVGGTTTGAGGIVTERADELFDDIDDAIRFVSGDKLWVREVLQDDHLFGALQCYDDAVNPDNLEGFSIGGTLKGDINCVAFNVPVPTSPPTTPPTGGPTPPGGDPTPQPEGPDEVDEELEVLPSDPEEIVEDDEDDTPVDDETDVEGIAEEADEQDTAGEQPTEVRGVTVEATTTRTLARTGASALILSLIGLLGLGLGGGLLRGTSRRRGQGA